MLKSTHWVVPHMSLDTYVVLVPVLQDLWEMQETHKCHGVLIEHEVPTGGLLESLHSKVRR